MALLQLEGISKRFGRVVVAEGISFQLEEGKSLGVIGPNGAGKSSMFGLISGDIKPDEGSINFDGTDLRAVRAPTRCRMGIGRTYQIPQPFEHLNVFENALVAAQQGARTRGSESYELAYHAVERTGLADLANRPAGSLTLLHRKRLELARALATRPKMLLLDEIAGGLTDPEVLELTEVIKNFQRDGLAIIWIEHVVRALLSTVDRLMCIANGAVIADGDPHEVLRSEAVRSVYLGGKIINEAPLG
ncbi:MAG TPA: ABC transporter ATP-binding protein [Acidimicrobiales bacterium]|nr:ABC transporter ATP-binding protein [Acidimicrobiales bacterium]